MCYHTEFGSSTSEGVNINREEPQNWGAGATLPWGGSGTDPLKIWPSHTEFGSSTSEGVNINGEEPQNLGSWGHALLRWGRDWPLENTPLPWCVILPNLVILDQIVQA